MNSELERLKSFESEWDSSFVDKNTLARLGFYNVKVHDIVKCFCCAVELGNWDKDDDVLSDHRRLSPKCPFICQQKTSNIAIDDKLLNDTLRRETPTSASGAEKTASTTVSEGSIGQLSQSDINMYNSPIYKTFGYFVYSALNDKTAYPAYEDIFTRMESFADWPIALHPRPRELSEAGFFYTGRGDRVICYLRGSTVKDWQRDDDPWTQHAMWCGGCEYVEAVKGKMFVQQTLKQKAEMLRNGSK